MPLVIEAYEQPDLPALPVPARAGTGYGATEAPRGVLFHRYRLAADGTNESVRIVPPTSQNQAAIENDLRRYVTLAPGAEPANAVREHLERLERITATLH